MRPRRSPSTGRPIGRPGNAAERALDDLVGWPNLTQIDDFVEAGLHEALTIVIDRIHGIGEAIHRTYFDQRDSLTPPESSEARSQKPVLAASASFAPDASHRISL